MRMRVPFFVALAAALCSVAARAQTSPATAATTPAFSGWVSMTIEDVETCTWNTATGVWGARESSVEKGTPSYVEFKDPVTGEQALYHSIVEGPQLDFCHFSRVHAALQG